MHFAKILVEGRKSMKTNTYLQREGRKRNSGAGRPFKLQLQNRLLMLRIYYRMYITYTLAGFLFGIDRPEKRLQGYPKDRAIGEAMPANPT